LTAPVITAISDT